MILPDYTPGRKPRHYPKIQPMKIKAERIDMYADRDWIEDGTYGYSWGYMAEVFAERRIVKGANECWDYLGPFHRQGYGLLSVHQHTPTSKKHGMMNIQRLAFAIHLGWPLYPDERVASTCRNLVCTNPAHLHITDYTHQCDHVDRSYAFEGRKRRYTSEFFVANEEVLANNGPVMIARLLGLPEGRGAGAKTAYNTWVSRGRPNLEG